jgi:epoxyqueuosine reductase
VTLTSAQVQQLAHDCGFEIAGVAAAVPHPDFKRFQAWSESGKAADLSYLTDHRATLRADPRTLLPSAKSIICLGKLYNTDRPLSTETVNPAEGWISRYAWGFDYHDVLRRPLKALVARLGALHGEPFNSKICIDTAPLLERSYAHAAGLGWIGKNTCLINERHGSWFFLAELLVSIGIAPDTPPPDRCGTCTRCIQACPTHALVPNPANGFDLDARLCISYLTIEKRDAIPAELAALQGRHVFGCDICQDVCPWNQRAHRNQTDMTDDASFAARIFAPGLAELSVLQEDDFRRLFRQTPIWRSKYEGFLRNVAVAMGNSGKEAMREPLRQLSRHDNQIVSQTAQVGLRRLDCVLNGSP